MSDNEQLTAQHFTVWMRPKNDHLCVKWDFVSSCAHSDLSKHLGKSLNRVFPLKLTNDRLHTASSRKREGVTETLTLL